MGNDLSGFIEWLVSFNDLTRVKLINDSSVKKKHSCHNEFS